MKLNCLFFLSLALSSVSAFTVVSQPRATLLSSAHRPAVSPLNMVDKDAMTLEEEVDMMLKTEREKAAKLGKISSETGNKQFAPWMGQFGEEEEKKLRAVLREKAQARRRQRSSMSDSTVQEISGTGLRGKVVDGNCVELSWATSSETNTKGFIVKRRPAKTEDFTVLASFKDFGPLASKGDEGGVYRFLDETAEPGGWVYRVTECESNGREKDLSQCLVEIQTQEEQMQTKIALAGFGIIAAAAVAAGFLLDPSQ